MHSILRGKKIEIRLAVVLALMCIGLSIATPQFATLSNFTSLLNNNAINLIWAVGLLVVLIAGGSIFPSPSPPRSRNMWAR